MPQAALVPTPWTVADGSSPRIVPARAEYRAPMLRFESLVLTEPRSLAKGRSSTLAISLVLHSVLIVAVIVVPLFLYDYLPAADEAVHAFFVTPAVAAPPPPPPPPPARGVRATPRTPVVTQAAELAKFVAPIEAPAEVKPEEGLSFGVEGGVPGGVEGGVEGGVPGGIVGGIVGGLPPEPPPPPRVVRVGGQIKAPQLVKRVDPVYPELGRQARLSAFIILEATVESTGRVRDVTLLRGASMFDEPAMDAVRQWIYKPLLLNGVPTPFVVTVTVKFTFRDGPAPTAGPS
jgi:protein TonB